MEVESHLQVGRRVAEELVERRVVGFQLVAAREDEDRVRRRRGAQRRQQRPQTAHPHRLSASWTSSRIAALRHGCRQVSINTEQLNINALQAEVMQAKSQGSERPISGQGKRVHEASSVSG